MADINREQGVETGISGEDAAAAEQRAGVNDNSELRVDDGPGDLIRHGRVTVVTAGVPVSLLGPGVSCRGVTIKNPIDNTGNPVVFVGGASVTAANGYPLNKGEGQPLSVDNADDEIFVDADTNGTDVVFLGADKSK